MRNVDRDLEKLRLLLREVISESGWTPAEIQRRCGWGRTALSRVLNGHGSLRVEELLTLLDALGVEPARFFARLYGLQGTAGACRLPDASTEEVHGP